VLGVVQGAHPHPIPGQDQALGPGVPQREGPLPVEAVERVLAPLLPGMDDDLGVAAGAEGVAGGHQLGAQLDVVEDLAVEDDPHRLVLVGHGLLPRGQVDDREPGVGQAGVAVVVAPELVGATMEHRPHHVPERAHLGRTPPAQVHDPGDATHGRPI